MLFQVVIILLKIWSISSELLTATEDRFFIDRQGDFIFGGLFPIHLRGHNENTCGSFHTMPGYHYLQAMLHAVDTINNDSKILPNVTLGVRIYDSCHSQTIGARMTKEFIKMTLTPPKDGRGQLVGVIGSLSSDLCKVIADFLRVFKIPQISYGATASVLSDKSIYSYFFRTVPPDTWQVHAMVDVIQRLNWTYVLTVNSEGLYGEKGIEVFLSVAKSRGICIAASHSLPAFASEEKFDRLVTSLRTEQRARVIVLFTSQEDSRALLQAFKRNPVGSPTKRFYLLASDAWSNNAGIADGLEAWAEGAITLAQLDAPVRGFNEYFKNLNINQDSLKNDTWFQHFWESHFQSSLENKASSNKSTRCSGSENLTGSDFHFAPIRTVMNAVYAMAHALDFYLRDRCASGPCPTMDAKDREEILEHLKHNVTFIDQGTGERLSFNKHQETPGDYSIYSFQRKDMNGGTPADYGYQQVGIWWGPRNNTDASDITGRLELNTTQLFWPGENVSHVPPVSMCAEACPGGEVRRRKGDHDLVCCWTCFRCGARDIIVNNTCRKCEYGYVPDQHLSQCTKLPILDTIRETSSKAILAVAAVGFVCVVLVAAIFFRHGNEPLVKASSRELSGILLFGLALLFVSPVVLLTEPNRIVCISQPFILGLALASCYAPLFMKILRIYRIFNGAKRSASKPLLVSPASQVFIATGLILIQLLFSALSFFPTPPVPEELEIGQDGGSYVILMECSMDKTVFASLLSYNMFLMALCTVMAFKTRRFPRNFNEAKYIGFTMYFTCFVWIIFFPSYLSSANGLQRINWECGAVLFIGWITLIGLFGPKVYILFMVRQVSITDQLAMTNNTPSQGTANQVSTFAVESQHRVSNSQEKEVAARRHRSRTEQTSQS